MITFRPATAEDLPFLQKKINDSDQEMVDLSRGIVHVAEEDGEIIGLLNARIAWWQLEPLYIWGGKTTAARRRAAVGLFKAAESWIADRSKNKTGIYSFWFVTKAQEVADWVSERITKRGQQPRLGCMRIYQGCQIFGKDV